jgi:hypothetical protein
MTAWDDYVSAIGELDVARRTAAAAVASQERAAAVARTDLREVRARIARQRIRIAETATRAHRPPPLVEPQPGDHTNAATLVPVAVLDPTPGVNAALTAARAALDTSDTVLTIVAQAPSGGGLLPSWQPARRNLIPYMWYALLAAIALFFADGGADRPRSTQTITVTFAAAVALGAYVLAVASIALLFAPDRAGRRPMSLGVGLLICAVPLAFGLALAAF